MLRGKSAQWVTSAALALMVAGGVSAVTAGPAAAVEGNSGCAHVSGGGNPSSYHGRAQRGCVSSAFGHVQLRGPGGLNRNSPDSTNGSQYVEGSGRGGGDVCATFWEKKSNYYINRGTACFNVH